MVSTLLTKKENDPFIDLLRPEPLADGAEPEERLVYCGVSWQRYLDLDKALGDDRPGPRFYYLDNELEIMTTSNEHERIKTWMGDFLAIYFEIIEIEVFTRGQATLRKALENAGAEPDESWCLHDEKEYPDLVLEIALTSGGINKLEIYKRFNVPEVWFWRRNELQIFTLRANGSGYDPSAKSQLLPDLDLDLLQRCVAIDSWLQARKTFRTGLA